MEGRIEGEGRAHGGIIARWRLPAERRGQNPKPDPAVLDAWWCGPFAGLETALRASRAGLSSTEARRRLDAYGANQFRDRPQRSALRAYLSRFKNPLVLILLAASAVSAMTGQLTSFVIITVMVLVSVTLDFVQEFRADQAAERLRAAVALSARVSRDAAQVDIPFAQLVPGDVVMLVAGDMVPADGRVAEAHDFFVNQSLLTGEPFPVEKRAADLGRTATALQDAANAVFMGTSVMSGTARVLIVRTGQMTAIGGIAEQITRVHAPTSLERGTREFGLMIVRLTSLLVIGVLFVNAALGRPWLESFLFALALAVGLTPELLPMVVSVTLARGALRMAQQRVIVKRLAAIHDLGAMTVLCTDKTGTLTEARIALDSHVDAQGHDSPRVLELAYVNSRFETGLRSPLDEAVLAHEPLDLGQWSKLDEVPFDFQRRRVSVLALHGGQPLLVLKGAPEEVLRNCAQVATGEAGAARPLDTAARAAILARCDGYSRDGLRVLAIASRAMAADRTHITVADETDLSFVGFVTFLDPPKAGARDTLRELATDGVALKVVTGDNELVTRHVCAALGLATEHVLTGQDLEHMDDGALAARADQVTAFCRVNPAQKERIIRALRARGHVVGYLGDGINDAPPLHAADVGLSVESAVDVAKQAADMILLERDLHVVHEGVLEGRRTVANVRKYVMMGTSSNFGNMFSMAGAAAFLPFLPMLPVQILLNNLLYDVSELAVPLDRVDSIDTALPRRWNVAAIRNFMLVIGPVSSLFDFLTFYLLLVLLRADAALFQTGWFIESLATQVLVILVIRTRGAPWRSRPHPALIAAACGTVAAGIVLPFTPLGTYFGFVRPPPQFFLLLVGLVVPYLAAVEIVKRAYYARIAR
jgi:Mg2+-importing ATPase